MPKKRYDVPPLDLLKGFEAAARHLSFTKAADELFLTQSAVSRQIKALEDHLQTPLFRRGRRGLALTEAGRSFHRTVADMLDELHAATRRLRGGRGRALTVTTTPGFASLWLIPRLAGYTRAHPNADVRISATNETLDLERDGIDLAVRYCAPEEATGTRLFSEEAFPVLSPALLQETPLAEPADLDRHVLLYLDDIRFESPFIDWPAWREAMKIELRPAGALRFNHYNEVIAAAVAGQGVALGRMPLVKELLDGGRLVAPLRRWAVSVRAYYIVESAAAVDNPDARDFIAWLLAEAGTETAG